MNARVDQLRQRANEAAESMSIAEDAHELSKVLVKTDGHLRKDLSTFESDVILKRATDITVKAVEWLWRYWLALGKVHILAGAPGQGKTTIALAAMATVTSGGRWPDGSKCPIGNCLMWTGEDDHGDTLNPRLIAMGADLSRIYFVEGARIDGKTVPFDPARDMVQLTAAATRIGNVALLVVDPVVSAVTGDSHKNTEVRRALQPLVDLASHLNAAVLGISHFAKGGQGKDPTERVVGSVAFSAVARVVLVAAKVQGEDGTDRRILARSKSNLGPDDGGFEYSLDQVELVGHPGIFASRVLWGDAVAGTARVLLAEAETDGDGEASAKQSAEGFLRELLTAPTPTKTVQAEARDAGHAWATVRRAADSLNVLRKKGGMDAGWYWSLPEGAQPLSKMPIQIDEHLRDDMSTFGATAAADNLVADADSEVL